MLTSCEVILFNGLGALELCCFVVVERLLVSHAATLGCRSLDDVCFFRLVGAEGVAAELGVGPASADEAFCAGPVFGEVVEEAACTLSE